MTLTIKIIVVFLLTNACLFTVSAVAAEKQTIAVLPFEIISPDDITYIQSGILGMLHSRLSWKDHVDVVDKKAIQAYTTSNTPEDPNRLIEKIAGQTGSDYVLTGTITHFSNAFSIDTRIIDIKNNRHMLFSEQSDVIDDIIPKLNTIVARINKKVFDRKTIAFERLAKEEKDRAEQWKRRHPEEMMPKTPRGMQEKKPPFWKFWEYL